jgi:hypothetical protein
MSSVYFIKKKGGGPALGSAASSKAVSMGPRRASSLRQRERAGRRTQGKCTGQSVQRAASKPVDASS